jgi:hypothetical protein
MAISNSWKTTFWVALLTTASFGQGKATSTQTAQTETGTFSIQVEVIGQTGTAIETAVLALRSSDGDESVALVDSSGRAILSSIRQGRYEVTVEAAGFKNLSRTITITKSVDLGRIPMERDPDILHVHSHGEPPVNPLILREESARQPSIRGRILPSAFFTGKSLTVQLSCSEQRPGEPQRPPMDREQASVDDTGSFLAPVPECLNGTLAHREIRFSLKDSSGHTVAFLLPHHGYQQSRFGIWLPVKAYIIPTASERSFYMEFADNHVLTASIALASTSYGFLQATLTNTSDEVLAVSQGLGLEDYDWIISDARGNRVPFRLFRDRMGEQIPREPPRRRFLFPGDRETEVVNIGLLFRLESPGTYRAVARRIIERPELPGREQITSPEITFVVDPQKRP